MGKISPPFILLTHLCDMPCDLFDYPEFVIVYISTDTSILSLFSMLL